ncbi:MAG TPA: tRNA preQ1(34) S-adenosylmethionine ribosyltransferase-isomerase QueA [Chloroflexota bacterium]|jgi:S-adenosylmethionine:tRNA ribosyltransferase-isomerase|nr:tRNA preQ1(34) S-adenosylmethionine ribosyltransferase-isomerase QueA [Chloroflexota bacterium]
MQVSDFDYDLPPDCIAQEPLPERDASRLLLLDRLTGAVAHHMFRELPDLLRRDDVLVVNDSKVLPARLHGRKGTGGKAEVLLVRPLEDGDWLAITRPGLAVGGRVIVGQAGLQLTVEALAVREDGLRLVRLRAENSNVAAALAQLGELPTPPYIHTHLADPTRYQTIYAAPEGSIAAPTAGLHFTERVLAALTRRGIAVERLTLHVGPGTFLPVRTEAVHDHKMHAEWYTLTAETAERINAARRAGRRIVAVGTTTCRALESAAQGGELQPGSAETALFITPGYQFQVVDGLLTNFHLPRSTLLMLVSALAGREHVLAAYAAAVREDYRFYSFGDAMLIA